MAHPHPLMAAAAAAPTTHAYQTPHAHLLDPFAHHPHYEPLGALSSGAHQHAASAARLVLARDRRTNERVAVKLVPRGWSSDDPLRAKVAARELLLHQALSLGGHPHVLGFREAFLSPTHLCVAMEYVEGGEDLRRFLLNTGGR
jgi:serine/threonine-protein kinase SRK2